VTAYLDTRAVASRIGVTADTVSSYRARGYLPQPDIMLGRSPGWLPETIEAWIAARPGKGAGAGRPRKASP
jgi:predicted DNA-binding transcriptional regulator AlpA